MNKKKIGLFLFLCELPRILRNIVKPFLFLKNVCPSLFMTYLSFAFRLLITQLQFKSTIEAILLHNLKSDTLCFLHPIKQSRLFLKHIVACNARLLFWSQTLLLLPSARSHTLRKVPFHSLSSCHHKTASLFSAFALLMGLVFCSPQIKSNYYLLNNHSRIFSNWF